MTSTPSPTSRIHGCLLGAAASEAAVLAGGAAGTGPGNGALHLGAAGQLSFYTADALVEVLEWANAGVYADQTACVWLAYLRWAEAQGVALPASAPSAPPRWIDTQPATNHQLPVRPSWVASLAGGEMGTQARPLGAAYDDGAAAARSAAFGLVVGTPADAVAAMALDGAHLTHGHPSAVQAAAALALVVRELAAGGSLRSAIETSSSVQAASRNPAADVANALEGALTGRHGGEPRSPAARALGAALEAALDAESEAEDGRFQAAVDRAGAVGPDAAAMTGALLGALWGADAVPEEWARRLEGSDIAAELAATLARASGAEE
ncbi:ADP-ribosylglycohydrolase family protein [Sinomonas sp. P47F7]|uniref:ADP-ribosylglycohydrolase family protein n=1 Tax=Sinomonas sp. P47F7 TaxID=3410987 RepID=UPI003BF57CA8